VLKAIKDSENVRTIILTKADTMRRHLNDRAHRRDLECRRARVVNIGFVPAPQAPTPAPPPATT
jgi:hypothetical protein